jgi:ribosomal protein L7Ae-like RNA K-turn-binding protein
MNTKQSISKKTREQKKKKKRKLPTSFLECQSVLQVVDFPSGASTKEHQMVSSNALNDVTKEIFLERLVKEIVKPFALDRSNNKNSFVMRNGKLEKIEQKQAADTLNPAKSVWKQRIAMGTNQCLRILERANNSSKLVRPILCVCARDIYPPTMLAHVPVMTTKLKIPLLILGGKASLELGKALGVRKASILLFLPSDEKDSSHEAVNSFCSYAVTLVESV